MCHVLMTYPGLIPSVILCGQLQLFYLAEAGKFAFRSVPRAALTPEICGWADVVFFVRSDSKLDVEMAERWKREGKLLIYVMDDDLLHVPPHLSAGQHYGRSSVQNAIQGLLEICDYFLSPSELLRKKYGKGRAIAIEEPAPIQPDKVFQKEKETRLGFAGSIDRESDLDSLLTEVIGTLLKKYGSRISVEFFGARPALAEKFGLQCYPYCEEYREYQQKMAALNWDIGLAPMPLTPFHKHKHYNKFIEYAGYGITGAFSKEEPYTRVIRDGINGVLCDNTPQAWIEGLSHLIEDTCYRRRISCTAQMQARTEFSIDAVSLALEIELGAILQHIARSHRNLMIPVGPRIETQANRLYSAIRRYGIYLPQVAAKKFSPILKKKREH